MRFALGLAASAAMLLTGACSDGGRNAIRPLRIVGSSTVYPFTTAVAEQFARINPQFNAPTVESTGTGGGVKLFCAGVGINHPDIVNASRRIKASELEDCAANGVNRVIELQIGIDGIALAEARNGPKFRLTTRQFYQALAARPFGQEQRARNWSDIDPALPNIRIQVYGPPPTSGTRDALAELILMAGCESDPAMKALKKSDEDRHKRLCTGIREDGSYIEAGENDNLLIQKISVNPGALGVLGYGFLERNLDKVAGVPLDGVEPTYQTISDFSYPGARPLYIYVKGEHLEAIPGLKQFVGEYAAAWVPNSYLARRGLIAAPAEARARSAVIATTFTPLSKADL